MILSRHLVHLDENGMDLYVRPALDQLTGVVMVIRTTGLWDELTIS